MNQKLNVFSLEVNTISLASLMTHILFENIRIKPYDKIKNLGIYMDCYMCFNSHIVCARR